MRCNVIASAYTRSRWRIIARSDCEIVLKQTRPNRSRLPIPTRIPAGNALSALRRRYFSHASESAARYGVTFDRIVQHLWDARRRGLHVSLRSVFSIDDLVHVIGCIDCCARAWHDLIELYEPWLVRQHRHQMDDCAALLEVRQFLVELRRQRAAKTAEVALRDYLGDKPLRNWLASRARLSGRLTGRTRWTASAAAPVGRGLG